ncbi:membrane protein [Intrasporangium chromatireducens Q5-1]|uniref:Membrane protein n=1 Tax=Intrasporangium chromatireducens Q5-1 TaxID=584657 RepID=W9GQP0_9MICO|nr:membrane protein [Intrasporangium chromatireducens Q5-1]
MRTWPPRRWWFAVLTAAATIIVVAIPTALISTPWFTREIPPTPWAWPVLVVTSLLAGLVAATYVARKDGQARTRSGSLGTIGAITAFFAVGCPVCNKLVLLALGYTGALQMFEPIQPFLATGSIALLLIALVLRIRREQSCPLPQPPAAQ